MQSKSNPSHHFSAFPLQAWRFATLKFASRRLALVVVSGHQRPAFRRQRLKETKEHLNNGGLLRKSAWQLIRLRRVSLPLCESTGCIRWYTALPLWLEQTQFIGGAGST